jgi:hypothetical protein
MPTIFDTLWRIRGQQAFLLLDDEEHDEESFIEINDLVAACQEELAAGRIPYGGVPDWLPKLEQLADELEEEFGLPDAESPGGGWQEFLAEHPELTKTTATAAQDVVDAPLEFTDDEVLAAVAEAIKRHVAWIAGFREVTDYDRSGAHSGAVADVLPGNAPPSTQGAAAFPQRPRTRRAGDRPSSARWSPSMREQAI